MIALLVSVALGQGCALDLSPPAETLSVAWVSPVGARASGGDWLWVTPTAELAAWMDDTHRPTLGGLLRHLGLRRRRTEPAGRYKVVVFDAPREVLCRPVEGEAPGALVAGVPVCEPGRSRATRFHDGCGRSIDRDGNRGATWYRARWRDLTADGFCVLPATRFVDEVGGGP